MAKHVSGGDAIRKKLQQAEQQWKTALATGLYTAGGVIMTGSKRRVPVDLGALKGSGYVTLPVESGGVTTVELGYGGPAQDYAVKQHEDLTLNHPEGGQARFLSQAAEEHESSLLQMIKTIATQAFASGSRGSGSKMHPTTPDQGGGET